MSTRRYRDAAVGLGYVVLVVALIGLSIACYSKMFDRSADVSLATDKIGSQLHRGSDVKIRGVVVGEVSAVQASGAGVDLTLALDPSKMHQIPDNVSARLLPKTLFGERYVALVPPSGAVVRHLQPGDVVQQDRSKQAVELQHVFDNLLPLLKTVQPEKLAATLGEMSQALRNRGGALGDTMITVDHYLRTLSPHIPTLAQDLDDLGEVSNTYRAAAPDLLDALTDLAVTSKTLAEQQKQLGGLFTSVAATANTAQSFLDSNAANIIGLSNDSVPTLQTLAARSQDFPCIADMLTKFKPKVDHAFGKGSAQPGLHATLVIRPALKPYTTTAPSYPTDAGPACATRDVDPKSALQDNGLGHNNAPTESIFLNELFATSANLSPSQMPEWSSLLLGPLARGSEVSTR